jgi:hypothetical protein
MDPAWFRILKWYPKNPTVPFLLGAIRNAPNVDLATRSRQDELRVLITSMRDEAPHGTYISIRHCPGLGELIVEFSAGTLRGVRN